MPGVACGYIFNLKFQMNDSFEKFKKYVRISTCKKEKNVSWGFVEVDLHYRDHWRVLGIEKNKLQMQAHFTIS